MRVLADVRRRRDAAAEPQRERRDRRLPRADRRPGRATRPARRRRGGRARRRGAPDFARARRSGCTSATPPRRARLAERLPGDAAGLRPAAPRRPGPDRPAAGRAARDRCAGLGLQRRPLADAAGVRRRADALRRHAASRGSRASSASGCTSRYRPGLRSKDWLKFAHRRRDSYVVGGWRRETDSLDRLGARAGRRADRRRPALPRPRRQRHRRQARPAMLRELLGALTRATTARSPTRCRGLDAAGHDVGRAGARRRRRVARPVRTGPAPPAVVRRRPRRPDPGGPHVRTLAASVAGRARGPVRPVPPAPATRDVTLGGVRVTPARPTPARSSPSTTPHGYHARLGFWVAAARPLAAACTTYATAGSGTAGWSRRAHRRSRAPAPPRSARYRLISAFGRARARRGLGPALPPHPAAATTGSRTTGRASTTATATRRRAASAGGCPTSDANSSERLARLPGAVRVLRSSPATTTSQVRHRGAGIFLHVNGRGRDRRLRQRPAARSCARLMWRLDPAPGARDRGRPVTAEPERDEVRVDVEGRTLTLSNLDKVLYPRTGTTKGEVLNYYAQVAPVLLPLLKRPPGHPGPLAARRRARPLLREERPGRYAALGAHRRRARPPARAATSRRRRPARLPDHRRPRHADLAGQPRRARAARAPVDGRPSRASRAAPTGS